MIITLTGPSCAGKSTLEAALTKLGVGRAISHTTRTPRAGEVDGVQYHFVSQEAFDEMNARGDFVEAVTFGGQSYALSGASLEVARHSFEHTVIVVEPHGAQQIHNFCRKHEIDSTSIWVDCDRKVQAQRWIARLMEDIASGKDVAGPYTDRLHMMLSEEVQWRAKRTTSPFSYHLDVDTSRMTPENLARDVLCTVSDPMY